MANARKANVLYVDTDNYNPTDHLVIKSIKYIGNTSGTANIKHKDDSGQILWEESGATNTFNECRIVCPQGIYVNLTNSAKVIIYLE